jgi:hypothetical protein
MLANNKGILRYASKVAMRKYRKPVPADQIALDIYHLTGIRCSPQRAGMYLGMLVRAGLARKHEDPIGITTYSATGNLRSMSITPMYGIEAD